ncbi:uncharacterized protein CELE_Y37E3.11 [Caenorhabditis elegans]|uniref:Secreted protein n=1 Tax=Caenorhabditis elegans TaxID=6239 RepID=X5M8X2_CAEEL|nr:Secreted protein [Caenorhabditis elegans]CDO41114.1 Secreted protein [Caenorhabditis elegans]|eukprot:NP_001293346.1 Phosphocholine CYtidylylTransferase [Caenorhabditis elegans]
MKLCSVLHMRLLLTFWISLMFRQLSTDSVTTTPQSSTHRLHRSTRSQKPNVVESTMKWTREVI